jgi:hypothetical protein
MIATTVTIRHYPYKEIGMRFLTTGPYYGFS